LSKFKLEVIKYSYIRDNEEVKQLLQAQIPEKLDEVADGQGAGEHEYLFGQVYAR